MILTLAGAQIWVLAAFIAALMGTAGLIGWNLKGDFLTDFYERGYLRGWEEARRPARRPAARPRPSPPTMPDLTFSELSVQSDTIAREIDSWGWEWK